MNFRTLLVFVVIANSALTIAAAQATDAHDAQKKEELRGIMVQLDFVPRFGADNPLCQAFFADFKQQRNIEHIEPIIKVEGYDDPALRPYQQKCPKLDFRKSLSVPANQNTASWTDEDWETLGRPSYGLGSFQLFRVDINNNAADGEEYLFYYEGDRTIDRWLTTDRKLKETEIIDAGARAYQALDLNTCKIPTGIYFNRLASEKWSRNGIIRYKDEYGIYVLQSRKGEKPNFRQLELYIYANDKKRLVPVCAYAYPLKLRHKQNGGQSQ